MRHLQSISLFLLLPLSLLPCRRITGADPAPAPAQHREKPVLSPPAPVFETTPGDPFGFRTYKLKNGLQVVLAKNTAAPRIMTYIAVHAGSVQDPDRSTGLAHYFEHLMFKGSARLASLNWKKEKPLLDRIEELFEQYRAEKDPARRKEIYQEIDRVSSEAAAYSNTEYWKIVSEMGAAKTNAFTSQEITAYVNDIPSNMLERFLVLERERFDTVSLRRFHTELETIYEEFNRKQDNDSSLAWNRLLAVLYPGHPLGREILGLPEHLKSPSVRDVAAFFKQYYIPSNMILILAGDLDFDKTMLLVEKTFGTLPETRGAPPPRRLDTYSHSPLATPSGTNLIPPPPPEPSAPIIKFAGSQPEFLLLAFRFPRNPETDHLAGLLAEILSNGRCGLMDKDLNQPQKVLSSTAFLYSNSLDNLLILQAEPLPGKSLEDLRILLLEEIEKLKNAAFPQWLTAACAANSRLALTKMAERRTSAAEVALSLFWQRTTMRRELEDLKRMEKTTPAQIADFARKVLQKPVALYKTTGKPQDRVYAQKPPITPLRCQDTPSVFYQDFQKIPAGPPPETEVINPEKLLAKTPLADGITLYSAKNPDNELFKLKFVFPAGSRHNLLREILFDYIQETGTESHSREAFEEELYKNAISLDFAVAPCSSEISISGLNRNLPRALDLLKERILQSKTDPSAFRKYTARLRKSRENARRNPDALHNAAEIYALYGPRNPLRCTPNSDEIEKLDPEKLTESFRNLLNGPFDAVYYGPDSPEKTASLLKSSFKFQTGNSSLPVPKQFCIAPPEKDMVFLCDYPGAAQFSVTLIRPDEMAVPAKTYLSILLSEALHHEFFSVLREQKSLGYVASAFYVVPGILPDNYSFFQAVLGSQPDKLQDGMNAIKTLADGIADAAAGRFQPARKAVLNRLKAIRLRPDQYYGEWKRNSRLKRPFDWRKRDDMTISAMTQNDFHNALNQHVARKRPSVWILTGDLKKIDRKILKPFGELKILTPDDILIP